MKKMLTTLAVLGQVALCAEEGGSVPQNNMMQTFLMIGLALVFFYFILWRPEQKRRKAMEQQRAAMKKGDRVVAMGIVGRLDKILDKSVVLKMVDGSKIEVLTTAISEVQPDDTVKVEESTDKT